VHITSLRLLAPDLPAQAAFYTRVLGLPLIHDDADELTFQAGATRLSFAAAPAGDQGAYHFAFNIPENQFASAKAWLAARVPLLRNQDGADEFDFSHWDAHAVYAADPASNILELIARHALPNGRAGDFDSSSLLEVSEIGLATPDVGALASRLEAELGLGVFRGSLSDSFGALGDETGLFILVRTGRRWYPDLQTPAQALPLIVHVTTATKRRFVVNGQSFGVVEET
jgi:catechol-2,3-dioxygenase